MKFWKKSTEKHINNNIIINFLILFKSLIEKNIIAVIKKNNYKIKYFI